MDISSEYGQAQVTLKTDFTVVPATFQSVSGLQSPNGRFNPRMALACVAELDGGRLETLGILLWMTRWQTRLVNNGGQLSLVFLGVKTTIKGSRLDPSLMFCLG